MRALLGLANHDTAAIISRRRKGAAKQGTTEILRRYYSARWVLINSAVQVDRALVLVEEQQQYKYKYAAGNTEQGHVMM